MTAPFKDTQEATFRRRIRDAIRGGAFTKGERDVILALVNHWFVHRRSAKGIIHPGRDKLAATAGVTIKTVTRCLSLLRQHGAITAQAHLNGLQGKATEYAVNVVLLLVLCDMSEAEMRNNGGTNVPFSGRDKMSRRSADVVTFPKEFARGAK